VLAVYPTDRPGQQQAKGSETGEQGADDRKAGFEERTTEGGQKAKDEGEGEHHPHASNGIPTQNVHPSPAAAFTPPSRSLRQVKGETLTRRSGWFSTFSSV
jgi:hypothetical protein